MFNFPAIGFLFLSALTGFSRGQGTTPELKDIFMGRCYDYDLQRVGDHLPGVEADCPALWELFENAFAYQPSCGLDERRYVPFLVAASQEIPVDMSLFWSGTGDLAHRLSQEGMEYVTMEDSLIGYLVDSMAWCGQEDSPGMDFEKCPGWDECDGDSNSVFWDVSSTWFASQTKGVANVLLDGSNPDRPAYKPDSFFATVELPNMDPSKVTTVNVMLLKRLGHPIVETCYNGTLDNLRRDVMAKGLRFHCQENPDNVLHLMCVDDPSNDECDNVGTQSRRPRRNRSSKKVMRRRNKWKNGRRP